MIGLGTIVNVGTVLIGNYYRYTVKKRSAETL